MIDKNKLYEELTEKFIEYQHRLDCPMPEPTETVATRHIKYKTDPIFHNKVRSLVCGVMIIIDKHS